MTAYLTRPLNRGQVNATSTLLPLLPTLLSLPVSTYSSISLSQLSIKKNYYCLTASHIFSNKGIVSHTYPWKRSTGMQHINGQVSKRELTRLTSWFRPLLLTPILNKADTLKLCETLWETMVPHPYCNKNVKIVTPKWVSSECRFPAYFRWEWNYEEENLEVKAINTLLSACLYLTELMIFLFVGIFSYGQIVMLLFPLQFKV